MAKGKKTGGRNFKPGQSGNPAGGRTIDPELKKDLQANLVRRYGEDGDVLIDRIDKIACLTSPKLYPVALAANIKLLEYAKGKPVEKHELTGKDGTPLAPVGLIPTPELRARVLELLNKFPTP